MRVSKLGAFALAGATCACDSDLPVSSEVDGLRILAISAEGPWAHPGLPSRLSALVVGGPEVAYSWRWCPTTEGGAAAHQCPYHSDELPSQIPGLDLGTAATATLTVPEEIDWALLCELSRAADCAGDRLSVFVRLEVSSADDHLVGVKELPVVRNNHIHQNPGINGLTLLRSTGQSTRMEGPMAEAAVSPAEEVELELHLSPESAETVQGGVETLAVSWFADGGSMDIGRTRPEEDNRTAVNRWTAPDATEEPIVNIYVVVRDDRGGTSWASYTVTVGAP